MGIVLPDGSGDEAALALAQVTKRSCGSLLQPTKTTPMYVVVLKLYEHCVTLLTWLGNHMSSQ